MRRACRETPAPTPFGVPQGVPPKASAPSSIIILPVMMDGSRADAGQEVYFLLPREVLGIVSAGGVDPADRPAAIIDSDANQHRAILIQNTPQPAFQVAVPFDFLVSDAPTLGQTLIIELGENRRRGPQVRSEERRV